MALRLIYRKFQSASTKYLISGNTSSNKKLPKKGAFYNGGRGGTCLVPANQN